MTYKSVFAYLGNVKLRPFAKSTESKAVNARDEFRGLYLFGRLGSRRPHITVRKKSHVFLCPQVREKKIRKKVSPQGLGQKKKNSKDEDNYYSAYFSNIIDFRRQSICPKRWFLVAP